jgi:transcriptional regulator with XRE-family HTH domain
MARRQSRRENSTARHQFGKRLRAVRTERGISQERLSEMVDGHRNFIGQIERGEANPTFDYLVKIAKALKVSPAALFDSIP